MSRLMDEVSPWSRARHIRRAETNITFGVSSRQVLGANPNRIGLIISVPNVGYSSAGLDGTANSAVDTSTIGVKSSRQAPANANRVLKSATFQETAGTGVVADLELVRSATTFKLARYTTSGQFQTEMPLQSLDTIQWNVTTPIGASTSDFTITLQAPVSIARVTLSVNSPAVDGVGLCLYAGTTPFILWRDVIGDALTEDLYGIASVSSLQIGIWDLFY